MPDNAEPDKGLETISPPLDPRAKALVECCPPPVHTSLFGGPDLLAAKRFRKLVR
jgi:hypothetical protein